MPGARRRAPGVPPIRLDQIREGGSVIIRSSNRTTQHSLPGAGGVDDAVRGGVRIRRFGAGGRSRYLQATEDHGVIDRPTAAILGLGPPGITLAIRLLSHGFSVTGVDLSRDVLSHIAEGRVALPADERLHLLDALDEPRMHLSAELSALAGAETVFLTVPIGLDEHGVPDLAPLSTACADVVRLAVPGQLIVMTSTPAVGAAGDLVVTPLESLGFTVGDDINVVVVGKRGTPSRAAGSWVIGGATPACSERARRALSELYPQARLTSTLEAAEMVRLISQSHIAVMAGLSDEYAAACDRVGVSFDEVAEACEISGMDVGSDMRCVGPPPDDAVRMSWQLRRAGRSMRITDMALSALGERSARYASMIVAALRKDGIDGEGGRVLLVGATASRDTGAASCAHRIAQHLAEADVDVEIADEHVSEIRQSNGQSIIVRPLASHELARMDLVVIVTLDESIDPSVFAAARRVLDPSGVLATRVASSVN